MCVRQQAANITNVCCDFRVKQLWFVINPLFCKGLFMFFVFESFNSITIGAEIADPTRTHVFTAGSQWVCVTQSLFSVQCFVDHCLSFFIWLLYCMPFFDLQNTKTKEDLQSLSQITSTIIIMRVSVQNHSMQVIKKSSL